MRRRAREEERVTFDFAPMVDVVLLLVIFFMLTSNLTSRQNTLPLDLPRASSAAPDLTQVPTVSVTSRGDVYVNGTRVTRARLEAVLKPLVQASGGVVALRADERGNYGNVVAVIDAIKRAGGERLALGTRRE